MPDSAASWFAQLNYRSILLFVLSLAIFVGSPELVNELKDYFAISPIVAKYLTGAARIATLILMWYTKSPKQTPLGN